MAELGSTQDGEAAAPFSFGVRVGIILIAEMSMMSVGAVVALFFYILYIVTINRRKAESGWHTSSPFHCYLASLFLSEATTAVGGIMGIRWAVRAGVEKGPFCKAQGILFHLGNVGVALATLAIAFHTFAVLVFRWAPKRPTRFAACIVLCIWITCALIVGIGEATHIGKEYWGDTQYWCWITEEHPVQQILLEYIFLFLAAFVNILLYIPLAAVVSGKIIVQGWRIRLTTAEDNMFFSSDDAARLSGYSRRVAIQMLCYPLVYTITTMPVAVARFSAFNNDEVPFAITTFADMVFSLSGFFNVVLFTLTRPALIPRKGGDATTSSSQIITVGRMSMHSPTSPLGVHPSIALNTLQSKSEGTTDPYRGWNSTPASGGLGARPFDDRSDTAPSMRSSVDNGSK